MSTTVEQLSIAEASAATGVSVDTLRYYERAGVLPHVERASSGHRVFTADDLNRVTFVRRLRATGMSMQKIADYTDLVHRGDQTVSVRRRMIEQHRETVAAALVELTETLAVLDRKIAHYEAAERGEDLDCRDIPLVHVPELS